MIFLDTSAIYALADRSDPNHRRANASFVGILEAEHRIVTHNYVLVESLALLQHRLGVASAVAFHESTRAFDIEWVDQDLHRQAASQWSASRRKLSFVDHVSFVLMERRGIETAFAFDVDFEKAGFRLWNP